MAFVDNLGAKIYWEEQERGCWLVRTGQTGTPTRRPVVHSCPANSNPFT